MHRSWLTTQYLFTTSHILVYTQTVFIFITNSWTNLSTVSDPVSYISMFVRSNAVKLPLVPFPAQHASAATLAMCHSVNCQCSVMLSIVRICSFLQTEHTLCHILSLLTFKLHRLTQHLRDMSSQIHAVHLPHSYGNSPCIRHELDLKTGLYTEVNKIIPALTMN